MDTLIATDTSHDGRRQRSRDSQRRIVAAMLELVAEGHVTPSAELVADRAKVGQRSVFRHFKDMDNLYREMADSIAATLEADVNRPFKATDWYERLLEVVDRRARVFERLTPFLRASRAHRHRSDVLNATHLCFVEKLRARLIAQLPPNAAQDFPRMEAVDLLLSFEAWVRLREEQKLSVVQAKTVVKHAIESLFRAGA